MLITGIQVEIILDVNMKPCSIIVHAPLSHFNVNFLIGLKTDIVLDTFRICFYFI